MSINIHPEIFRQIAEDCETKVVQGSEFQNTFNLKTPPLTTLLPLGEYLVAERNYSWVTIPEIDNADDEPEYHHISLFKDFYNGDRLRVDIFYRGNVSVYKA